MHCSQATNTVRDEAAVPAGGDRSVAFELLTIAARALGWVEEFALARQLLDTTIAAGANANGQASVSFALAARAELDLTTGDWATARTAAADSLRRARAAGETAAVAYAALTAARLSAGRGDALSCRAFVDEALGLAPTEANRQQAAAVLGLLAIGLRRPSEAIEALEPLVAPSSGIVEEPFKHAVVADLVEGYVRAARRADAIGLVSRCGSGGRRPSKLSAAVAARCRGLLATNGAFRPEFERALVWHAETSNPFERARTQLCFGERLRRDHGRREARRHLRDALATFRSLGAEPWAKRAEIELAASVETARGRDLAPWEPLTTQELEVARIVASGATNREAAEALFVSPKTIEFHLGNVFGKLGVRSRTQLAIRFQSAIDLGGRRRAAWPVSSAANPLHVETAS